MFIKILIVNFANFLTIYFKMLKRAYSKYKYKIFDVHAGYSNKRQLFSFI